MFCLWSGGHGLDPGRVELGGVVLRPKSNLTQNINYQCINLSESVCMFISHLQDNVTVHFFEGP